LEGGEQCWLVECRAIAEFDQSVLHFLFRPFRRGLVVALRGHGPDTEVVCRKRLPVELFTGVLLAVRGDVRMGDDVERANLVAIDDGIAQGDDSVHLGLRIGSIARVRDFNADGAGIEIGFAIPIRDAGVPGSVFFRHQTINNARFVDDVVSADFRGWVAKALNGVFGGGHGGAVNDEELDSLTVAVVEVG